MAANASDGAGSEQMIDWIKTRVELSAFEEAMWTAEHDAVVIEFIGDVSAHRLLMAVYDGALVMEYKAIPPVAAVSDELMCVTNNTTATCHPTISPSHQLADQRHPPRFHG